MMPNQITNLLKILCCLPFLLFSCTDGSVSPDGDYARSDSYGGGSGRGESGSGSEGGIGNGEILPGQITAGEWKDTENWDFWKNLMQNEQYGKMPAYWNYNIQTRIDVVVENEHLVAMGNIPIKLLSAQDEIIWEAKTDNKGNAILWGNFFNNSSSDLNGLKLQVSNKLISPVKLHADDVNRIVLSNNEYQSKSNKSIDIAFVVDATGSMRDELEYLKAELLDVIKNVTEKEPNTLVNMGAVFYRDEQDEYLTRVSPLSTEISKTVDFINEQKADGGGDFPEAVHTAMQKAINELQWNDNASARLLFLLLDAPPHHLPQVITEIHELVAEASKKGVKIIPVTASGIDKETEFLMRYMGIASNGSYVFITNHSGIGNEHLEPTVGEYEVEFLNELLVRVILENL